jgi:hypothetical protein
VEILLRAVAALMPAPLAMDLVDGGNDRVAQIQGDAFGG